MRKHELIGKRFKDKFGEYRVITIAEGYAMCRRFKGVPFIVSLFEIKEKCQPVDQ
jgi:hypothetical protein